MIQEFEQSSTHTSPRQAIDLDINPRQSVPMKTDKKDLLQVYSVSKLIFNEIKRLNQKNRDKKVLAKPIIVEI